ncbi:MAG: hypothetical protein AAGD38_24025, partial [Acidobacteriota bacterium]
MMEGEATATSSSATPPWEAISRPFMLMFWAMFWIVIDIRFGGSAEWGGSGLNIDLLPDVVGWVMMVSALEKLDKLDLPTAPIKPLRTLALWLLVLSIFGWVQLEFTVATAPAAFFLPLLYPVNLIETIAHVFFFWKLAGLVIEIAERLDDEKLKEQADFRRRFYLWSIVAVNVTALIAFVVFWVFPLLFLATLVGIIATIYFMLLLYGTAQRCRAERFAVIPSPAAAPTTTSTGSVYTAPHRSAVP